MSLLAVTDVRLSRDKGFSWSKSRNVSVKGYLFDAHDVYYEEDALLNFFDRADSVAEFRATLLKANGCFAVVKKIGDHVCAGVDRVRSIPLFFGTSADGLLLSDEARPVRDALSDNTLDPVSEQAFLHSGYTLEQDTLHPRVKQLGAGEILIWNQVDRSLTATPYFRHLHQDFVERSADDLEEELDELTKGFARRLLASARGKTIVIPLSGGYDSRLILCALKREGYQDAICYTYGREGSFEARVANAVARQLGYRHYQVCYDRTTWQTLLDSHRFVEYCQFVANECAVPHFQDLPALQELNEKRLIPHDALVVPGFCGDLLGGSYVPIELSLGKGDLLLAEGIDEYLLRQHFYLHGNRIEPRHADVLKAKIRAGTAASSIENISDFVSLSEDWFTRHKVAKFVVNALRVYEWLGYAWRMPLWDSRLIEWWYRIPVHHRTESTLYHRYLFKRLFLPMRVGFTKGVTKRKFETVLCRYLPRSLVNAIVRAFLTYRPLTAKANVNAFSDLKELLLERLLDHPNSRKDAHLNGLIALWWLLPQNQLRTSVERDGT